MKSGASFSLALLAVAGLALLYTAGHLLWYSTTPLGAVPVLDAREVSETALAMRSGTLPDEPFYRAPLYPALLALLGGETDSEVALRARMLNGLLHLLNALLVAGMTATLWRQRWAALAAGALYAFYPVAIHFAVDPLDITLAITCVLAAAWALILVARRSRQRRTAPGLAWLWMASLAVAIGIVTRPNLLLLLPILLLIGLYAWPRNWLYAAAASVGLPLLALNIVGWANLARTGEYAVLPTQGPYNFWVANRPGAHGKYFVQTVDLPPGQQHLNPARNEAAWLYHEQTGLPASAPLQTINDYWRARSLEMLANDPVGWIGRVARKGFYLFNQHEPYDIKTYGVQKEVSPWLRYNPLGFALVLALAVAGATLAPRGKDTWPLALLLLGLVASVLLFYVNARFRLPLVPFACLFAGGLVASLVRDGLKPRPRLVIAVGAGALAGIISLLPAYGVREPDTRQVDYLLMAQAALRAGDDAEAIRRAEASIAAGHEGWTARETLAVARFNRLLATLPATPREEALADAYESSRELAATAPQHHYMAGVYAWLLEREDEARRHWSLISEQQEPGWERAVLALSASQLLKEDQAAWLQRQPLRAMNPPLLLAAGLQGRKEALRHLREHYDLATIAPFHHHVQSLFGSNAPAASQARVDSDPN